MLIYKKLLSLINGHFLVFIIIIVLISYGQMLWMYPWQDDNALFFKLEHIDQPAGFFGPGPIGIGITKYTPTPFIPIHYFFGTNTVPYFALLLVLYLISTIVVYKTFSIILGKSGGRVAGFIFAAGYISSDGTWRMANSATTSISFITIGLLFFAYWKFYKENKFRYYLFALLSFFLATEFAINRTHYLFSIVVIFELIFLTFNRRPSSILFSVIRLVPFFYIFENFVATASVNRTPQMKEFLLAFINGKWDLYYGSLSTMANLIMPDWLTNFIKSPDRSFLAVLGVILLIIGFLLLIFIKKQRRIFLFLSLWFLTNIIIYSAFNPTIPYGTVERYMAHSFLALTGILGAVFIALSVNSIFGKVVRLLIILIGVGNLYNSVIYQHDILQTRSFPAREFFNQLKVYLPTLKKGDILYFDVARDSQRYYNDAISTAMMPETTAFAWRYGLDRYDIKLVTDFPSLINTIKEERNSLENVHSFWYGGNGLVDITTGIKDGLSGKSHPELAVEKLPQISSAELTTSPEYTLWRQPDLNIPLAKPLSSIMPIELNLDIKAFPINNQLNYPLLFPYTKIPENYKIFWSNPSLRQLALAYKIAREDFRENAYFTVSSEWQNNLVENLYDNDLNSLWQSERTGWGRENTFIEVRLPNIQEIGGVVWINGFAQNTPTKYNVETSLDGQKWHEVKKIINGSRIDNRDLQVVPFSPIKAKYVRMVLLETINGDSPVIAEFWVVPSKFSSLDFNLAEKFLKEPFWLVSNEGDFNATLEGLVNKNHVQLVWQGNKRNDWQSLQQTEFELIYDGRRHTYSVTLPAGGTQIDKLKITNMGMPGLLTLYSVAAKYLHQQ
ncbi:discoidin domain-containing protein [Candidatus Microgenomates bacterium]|nr:discoidin domain-containing protein [Candidatus Microgenomates bacterium]